VLSKIEGKYEEDLEKGGGAVKHRGRISFTGIIRKHGMPPTIT